jgi:dihydroneopterin aldolase
MDKIIINGMLYYGYHGVLREEEVLGQKFTVNATLFLTLGDAAKSDHLECTVNYAEIYNLIKNIVEKTLVFWITIN